VSVLQRHDQVELEVGRSTVVHLEARRGERQVVVRAVATLGGAVNLEVMEFDGFRIVLT